MIRITSKIEGFRRAGIAHPAKPTEHADGVFTKQQLAQLKAEPMLVVEEIEDKPASKMTKPAGDQSKPTTEGNGK